MRVAAVNNKKIRRMCDGDFILLLIEITNCDNKKMKDEEIKKRELREESLSRESLKIKLKFMWTQG